MHASDVRGGSGGENVNSTHVPGRVATRISNGNHLWTVWGLADSLTRPQLCHCPGAITILHVHAVTSLALNHDAQRSCYTCDSLSTTLWRAYPGLTQDQGGIGNGHRRHSHM